jgi:hypothetical protein
MTETQKIDEPKTVSIPGNSKGVVVPSGEILNPSLASVKSLTRCGQREFDAVIAWLTHERSENARRQAEREAQQAERGEEIRKEAEERARQTARLKAERPWAFE